MPLARRRRRFFWNILNGRTGGFHHPLQSVTVLILGCGTVGKDALDRTAILTA